MLRTKEHFILVALQQKYSILEIEREFYQTKNNKKIKEYKKNKENQLIQYKHKILKKIINF